MCVQPDHTTDDNFCQAFAKTFFATAYFMKCIMFATVNNFREWLLVELENRGWSQSDLARRANVSKAAISDVLSGRRNVGHELAQAIAEGLKLPVEQVYRAAGLLPPAVNIDEEIEQIIHEVSKLPKADREEVLAFIRMKNNLRKKKK